MHKDPPAGLFDRRRPIGHVITHGLVAGFILALVAHFSWSLWRQNSGSVAAHPSGMDALVNGLQRDKPSSSATTSPPAVRY